MKNNLRVLEGTMYYGRKVSEHFVKRMNEIRIAKEKGTLNKDLKKTQNNQFDKAVSRETDSTF